MILSNILTIRDIIKNIIDSDKESKIDITFKFKLLSILRELEPQYSIFEQIRNEKIMEYGKADEDGNVVIEKGSEAETKFYEDINRLISSDINVDMPKISTEDAFKYFDSNMLVYLYDIIEKVVKNE